MKRAPTQYHVTSRLVSMSDFDIRKRSGTGHHQIHGAGLWSFMKRGEHDVAMEPLTDAFGHVLPRSVYYPPKTHSGSSEGGVIIASCEYHRCPLSVSRASGTS